MSKVPPVLNSLRAFEAAARLGSFTRAADELGVTSAAVGQQVRSLEAYLNLTLFHRSPDGLEQTPRAEAALPALHRGFDQIAEAVRMLSSDDGSTELRVSISPSFGMMWLAPRLAGFRERYPGIEINVDATFQQVNIARGEVDLAIRFGPGKYPGLMSERILDECVLPICSPGLCESYGLRSIADVSRAPLIHAVNQTTDPSWLTWTTWADRHGLERDLFARGPVFTRAGIAMALKAAGGGQGVALTSVVCAIDEICAGRLVAPFGGDGAVRTNFGYDLVFSAALAETRPVAAFRAWVKSEVQATKRMIADVVQGYGDEAG